MRYRRTNYAARSTAPRTITVKFKGQCHCCGATIYAGEIADYYPALKAIAHMGGLEGTSGRCSANIKTSMTADYVRDPGEDAADRWNEQHGDRF